MPSPAVEVVGLTKAYGGTRVVDDLTLAAERGRVTALLGPNGAGKTTTVECCEGLRVPDAGHVRVLGVDPRAGGAQLRSRVGVMLQDGGLPAAARAGDVLRHVAALYARTRDLRELADRLGLDAFDRTAVRRLSGGQRQRLALAVAVVGRPELAFLDEPSAGLDPQGRHAVWDLVAELRDDGVGVVLTTHQMAEAETLADEVVIIDRGRLVARGAPAALVAEHASHQGAGVVTCTGPPGLAEAMTQGLAGAVAVREAPAGVYTVSPASRDARAEPAPDGSPAEAAPDGSGAGTVPPDAPSLIAAVTAWSARHGVLLSGFRAGPRTLEDLFLDLTGRQLR